MSLNVSKRWICLTRNVLSVFACVMLFHFETFASVRCEDLLSDKVTTSLKITNAHKVWTEQEANDFVWKLMDHFKTQFEVQKRSPMLKLDWESTEIDIRAHNDGMFDNIILSGALFKRHDIDPDMIALMVGHEIGHILGKRTPGRESDYTVEGEADFFGATAFAQFYKAKLLPETYDTQSEAYFKAKEQIGDPAFINSYGKKPYEMNVRALMAAYKNLTLDTHDVHIDYNSTDRSVVSSTTEFYPSPQIRLDTTRAALYGYGRPTSWALSSDFQVTNSPPVAVTTPQPVPNKAESIPQAKKVEIQQPKQNSEKSNSILNKLRRLVPRSLRYSRPEATLEDSGLLHKSYENQIGGNPREMGIVKILDHRGHVLDQEIVWGEYQGIRLANTINIILNRNSHRFAQIDKVITKHTHPLDLIDNPSLASEFSDEDIQNQKSARKTFDGNPSLKHMSFEHSIIYIDVAYAQSQKNNYEITNIINGKTRIDSKNVRVLTVYDPGK